MWSKTFKYLASKDYNVYSPGQHLGLCDDMYLVLYDGNTQATGGTIVGRTIVEIMIVMPENEHSKLDSEVRKLKEVIKGISYLTMSGFVSGTIHQVEKKAYSKVIECVNNRRL